MRRLQLPATICALCGKGASIGVNKPHSLHRTKRVVKPNLQTYIDKDTGIKLVVCTRCKRTLINK